MRTQALDAHTIVNVAGRVVHQPTHQTTATRPEALSHLLARQRAAFLRNGPPSLAERRATLKNFILSFMLRQTGTTSGTPIEVRNAAVIHAPAERVWDLLTDVARWPSWWHACRWVRLESPTSAASVAFRWKAHPVELRSAVVKSERPHCFAITADGSGVHAERTFTLRPAADGSSTVIVSHETQVGLLPWLGRAFLAPRLHAVNQAMFDDLNRAAGH